MQAQVGNICSANFVWLSLIREIFTYGNEVIPRGKKTLELLGHNLIVDMSCPVITVRTRQLSYRFMAAEAAWILSGDNRVSTIYPYNQRISAFSDNGVFFFGAYGPKIIDQLSYVLSVLVDDQSSRQAVMTIWRPNPPRTKDYPCTVSLQWMIREGILYCFANMRSSDAYLGVPYDMVNFSVISGAVALLFTRQTGVKLRLGDLYMYAASRHLYEENYEKAKQCLTSPEERVMLKNKFDPYQYSDVDSLIAHLWGVAGTNKVESMF